MLIKLTEEHCTLRGMSRDQIRRAITNGIIKGTANENGTWIEDFEVPQKVQTNKQTDLPPEASPEDLLLIKRKKTAELEADAIKAEIALNEQKSLRDKPEILKTREADLNAREVAIAAKIADVIKREQDIADSKQSINDALQELETESQQLEAQRLGLNVQKQEADEYLIAKKSRGR